MIWFEYKYLSLIEINKLIRHSTEFSIIELSIFIWLILFLVILTFYILPTIIYLLELNKKNREKENKKLMLKQIKIQWEIEHEIEEEMKNKEQEKAMDKINIDR